MPPQQNQTDYSLPKQSKLPLIVVSLLLILALVFGFWAFGQMQNYKNNSGKLSAAAVEAAKKQQAAELQAKYDDQAKSPYKVFQGSATYGTVSFNYPKTWSAYDGSDTSEPINAYFYPNMVPKTDGDTAYPLRVELLSTDYAQTVQQLSSQVTAGTLKASAYIPPKMQGVTNVQPGTRFDGAINQTNSGTQQGSMVVIKVRDKTLQISTESADGVKDFDAVVLASLTFVP
jgi:uncharacterized protein (UPF0333 family)